MRNSFLTAYSLFVFSLGAQVNLSSSLTACYALNGNSAEPINSLTGTISVVTPTVDRFNNINSAMSFNGSVASRIELPNDPLLKPAQISVSVWLRFSTVSSLMDIIYTKNIWASFFTAYSLTMQYTGASPKFKLYRQNGSGSNMIESSTVVAANTWYHVVYTIDNTSMKIYVNGILESTGPSVIQNFNYDPTKKVILGGTNEMAVNNPYSGTMDNLRFYNRVINAAEVSALYTQDPSCIAAAPVPVASFTLSQNNICAGNSIQMTDLSTNSPNAWYWQVQGATTPTSSLQNPVFYFPTPGIFTVTLTSSNNSGAGTATTLVNVLPSPTIGISASNTLVCIGSAITLTASGAASYTWSGGQIGASLSITPIAPTIYTVNGQSSSGCMGQSTISISTLPLPTVNIAASNSVICENGVVTMTASGASSYSWSTGQTGTVITVNPSSATTYTLYGTNLNGCTAQNTLAILMGGALPIITIFSTGTLVCVNSQITMVAAGASTYTWSTGQMGSSLVVAPSTQTTYVVSGTNAEGCVGQTTILVKTSKCVSLAEISNDHAEVLIYPNPVQKYFYISTSGMGGSEFHIYDLFGHLLISGLLEKDQENKVDASAFSKGIFFVTITNGKKNKTVKLIKE